TYDFRLNSRLFATLNKDTTPTGEVVSVSGTAFDFQHPKKLGEVFASDFRQSTMVGGIDHPFLLKKQADLLNAAELTSPDEKVSIQVKTDASGIVIFTANFGEDGPEMRGKKLVDHGGITFETQELPGAERLESFGDVTLEPNQVREFVTEYKINKHKEIE
ncbi:galactose-1-epimerase, partial [Enterococcus lactis]